MRDFLIGALLLCCFNLMWGFAFWLVDHTPRRCRSCVGLAHSTAWLAPTCTDCGRRTTDTRRSA